MDRRPYKTRLVFLWERYLHSNLHFACRLEKRLADARLPNGFGTRTVVLDDNDNVWAPDERRCAFECDCVISKGTLPRPPPNPLHPLGLGPRHHVINDVVMVVLEGIGTHTQ